MQRLYIVMTMQRRKVEEKIVIDETKYIRI